MVKYGIDYEIEKVKQMLLRNLKWTEVDFHGRVYKNPSKNANGLVPEVYTSAQEYKEVLTDDLRNGLVFFSDSDKHVLKGFEMEADVSIIFILNLSKLKGDLTRRDIDLQHEVLEVILKQKIFEFSELTTGLGALKEFDTSKIQLNNMQPWHIFSITGKIKYNINNC